MIRKILALYSCIATLYLCSSCSDFLDLEPQSYPIDDSFWKTEADANSAVTATYALLRQALNYSDGMTHYAYGDLPSDEFSTVTAWPYSFVANMTWSLAVPASETWNPMLRLRRYDLFYRVIDQANRVLHYVAEMPADAFSSEEVRGRYLGEAYYMRAFTYFYMARVWGGVPLVTRSVNVVDAEDFPAATTSQILAQCLSDIEAASGLLSWGYASARDRAIRANLGALYALAAHVYAWQGDYASCATAANMVAQQGNYTYVSRDSASYHGIYKGQSTEGIFEVSQNAANEGTIQGIGNFTLMAPYLRGRTGLPGLVISHTRMGELYGDDDLRLRSVFNRTLSTEAVICTKYANVTYTNETGSAIAIFKNNIIIFRYADIRLLEAEALAATGNESAAVIILNEVREKAGLDVWDNSGDLFEAIIEERGRELFLEGHRFFDLVRLARYNGTMKFGAKMTSSQFEAGKHYWPFDPSLLSLNKQLRQTPYWSTVNM
ncbi:RagB/SusD family nutrient uptake outer membrane protein [Parapedobacter tibetensis]|uniref:RagB/SusD family nutrient uptake outer membrane protein n=1 Tax=Parapedobacter tibetensis TaxID=2972951 RepID=UPI00214DD571|nr:RagB/SusD family nutrient uptake outer membrane protein [Parapedobacter tibetensis]